MIIFFLVHMRRCTHLERDVTYAFLNMPHLSMLGNYYACVAAVFSSFSVCPCTDASHFWVMTSKSVSSENDSQSQVPWHWLIRHGWNGSFVSSYSMSAGRHTKFERVMWICLSLLYMTLYQSWPPLPHPWVLKMPVALKSIFIHFIVTQVNRNRIYLPKALSRGLTSCKWFCATVK